MSRGKIPLTITDLTGIVVVSASVTINNRPGAATTIYQDETGATTLTNPTTTDANGRVPGWLDAGKYSATISGGAPAVLSYTKHFDILQADSEVIDDRVGGLLVAGANVTLTYNDAGNALTIAAEGNDDFALAKGDLYVGTGAGTAARLARGTDGQVLIADSAATFGLRWGTITPPFPDYTFTNHVLDRVLNADATTLQELGYLLGTAITDFPVFPAYTLTNVIPDRVFDANATSLNELADVLCTVIADLGFGAVNDYTVTNHITTRSMDCNATSIDQIADVLGTWITDLIGIGKLI